MREGVEMKTLMHWYGRWRRHLNDIDAHLDYPDIMAPSLPRDLDCRGEHEMHLHWEYRRKVLKQVDAIKQRRILEASSNPDAAGYKPQSLFNTVELFND
jgi:hypothetical protein